MVEWSRSGSSSISATCLSSSRSDQRACPSGAAEQARAINRASTSPVTIGDTGGAGRRLRATVASTSPPVSTNRFAILSTVSCDTPTRPAITARSSTGPAAVSSSNNTRARIIIRAGWLPVVISFVNSARSASDNATVNTFGRGIADHPLSRGKNC